MKRLSLILLAGLLCVSAFCQSRISIETLYNNFHQEKNVEKVNLGGLLLLAAKPFIQKELKGSKISSINVLSLDECSNDVKLRFNDLAGRLNDDKYELLLKTNEQDEKTRIFVRIKNEVIREFVIVSMGDEPVLVSIKGKIRPDDVQKLVNSNDNGK